jgi:hypothetical protein
VGATGCPQPVSVSGLPSHGLRTTRGTRRSRAPTKMEWFGRSVAGRRLVGARETDCLLGDEGDSSFILPTSSLSRRVGPLARGRWPRRTRPDPRASGRPRCPRGGDASGPQPLAPPSSRAGAPLAVSRRALIRGPRDCSGSAPPWTSPIESAPRGHPCPDRPRCRHHYHRHPPGATCNDSSRRADRPSWIPSRRRGRSVLGKPPYLSKTPFLCKPSTLAADLDRVDALNCRGVRAVWAAMQGKGMGPGPVRSPR